MERVLSSSVPPCRGPLSGLHAGLLTLLASVGLSACASDRLVVHEAPAESSVAPAAVVPGTTAAAAPQEEPAKKQEAKKKPNAKKPPSLGDLRKALDKKKKEHAEKKRAQGYAESELEIARRKAEAKGTEAEEKVRRARDELDEARRALTALEAELAIGELESQVDVERAESRVAAGEADLQGILEIYAEEREARNRDEIIRREQVSLELTKRGLESARAKAAHAAEHARPAKLRKASEKVRQAQADLEAARFALDTAHLESSLDVEKKTDAHDDAKRETRAAKRAMDSAQEKVDARTGAGK